MKFSYIVTITMSIRQISLNNIYSAPWIFLMEMENCLSRLRGVTENIEYTIDDWIVERRHLFSYLWFIVLGAWWIKIIYVYDIKYGCAHFNRYIIIVIFDIAPTLLLTFEYSRFYLYLSGQVFMSVICIYKLQLDIAAVHI